MGGIGRATRCRFASRFAVVVPRAGAALDVARLRDWLLTRTERYKVPEVFYIRDALPSGSTGKADRRAVARLAQGEC